MNIFINSSFNFYEIMFLLLIIFQNNFIGSIKLKSSNENKISELLLPMPLNITQGNEIIYLNKFCKFNLLIETEIPESVKKIISIYDKIINKNYYSYASSPFFKFNTNKHLILDSENSCGIEIAIKVNDLQAFKYTNDYKTEYESYSLQIITLNSKLKNRNNKNLSVILESRYINGLSRGLETLSQILFFNKSTARYEIYNLPLLIYDKPQYKYRGIMIDTSRHYISIDKIKEILEGMMFSKLNILHWHLTDDEYFGFGSVLNPKADDQYMYTRDQMEELVDFAFIRGITIIPEIDNPSHTKSWNVFNKSIVISKPEYGSLDPSKNLTYEIVDNLIKEATKIFSRDKYQFMHLGGDEVLSEMWNIPSINNFMKENSINSVSELENYYFNRIRSNLPDDKHYIYWVSDQAARQYDVYDKENSVLMYWGVFGSLKMYLDSFKYPEINRKLILTPGDYLYLDCGSGNKYGDSTWCGDYKSWKSIYNFPLFESYKNFTILGSQVVVFGELSDENSIIGKLFPRACSLSERLWSSSKSDIKNFFIRLINHNKRLIDRKVNSISFTTQLCENNPYECLDNIK